MTTRTIDDHARAFLNYFAISDKWGLASEFTFWISGKGFTLTEQHAIRHRIGMRVKLLHAANDYNRNVLRSFQRPTVDELIESCFTPANNILRYQPHRPVTGMIDVST
jgi:hypothetical protein